MRIYTALELRRHKTYNKILEVFKEQKTIQQTHKEVGVSNGYLYCHCKLLASKGYLSMKSKPTGAFLTRTFFFETLIDTFDIADLEERFNKASHRNKKVVVEVEAVIEIQGARMIKERHPSRVPAPKSRTWVSGSLGYSVW